MTKPLQKTALLAAFAMVVLVSTASLRAADTLPNILWITSEDMGPHIGAYGDPYAETPHLDALAERSLRYTNASSNAPVCAAARTALISGMYGPSTGGQHMRSRVPTPDWLKFYPVYLRELGYYTTNNVKEDYNLLTDDKGWHESSQTAHWKNRPEGMPFFAIFNSTRSHESQIRDPNVTPEHDVDEAPVPPYHPDVPEVRRDWAHYYDQVTAIDEFVAEKLQELEEAGLADDTIVFFFGDHGSGMPRGKRYIGWSGLRVPLIVHVPEKFRHLAPEEYEAGGASDRLVSFVDLGPTLISLAGAEPPDYYEGSAFMGEHETAPPEYSFGFRGRMDERPDLSRSVMDGRYIYIRNFMPQLPHGQFLWYQQQTPTTRVWREMYESGQLNATQAAFWEPHPPEELYDLKSDPHETVNLAGNRAHGKTLRKLRKALRNHMAQTRDTAFMPEPFLRSLMAQDIIPIEYARESGVYDFKALQRLLDLQLRDDLAPEDLRFHLASSSALERYWAAQIVLWKGGSLYQELEPMLVAILDDGRNIAKIAAGEAIGMITTDDNLRHRSVDTLLEMADLRENELVQCVHALNALERISVRTGESIPEAAKLPPTIESTPKWASSYLLRLVERF